VVAIKLFIIDTCKEVMYRALEMDKALHWYCKGCSRGVVSTWKKLQERQDKLEREFVDLREEVKGMKGKIVLLESGLDSNKKEWKDLDKRIKQVEDNDEEKDFRQDQLVLKEVENFKQTFKGIVKEQELEREKELKMKDKDIQQKMIEVMEREKRRNNLIIRGIKESSDEHADVNKIIETLVEEVNIKYEIVGRVGKRDSEGGKSRPLRIQLEDVDHKRRLLLRGKRLKDVQDDTMKNVYLAPNSTKMQQEEDKKLRDKVKEFRDKGKKNVRIAKGVVVSEDNGVSEVLFTLAK